MRMYLAHFWCWNGNEDAIAIKKQDIDDIIIAVDRQAYVNVHGKAIDGSLYRKVEIVVVDVGTEDM